MQIFCFFWMVIIFSSCGYGANSHPSIKFNQADADILFPIEAPMEDLDSPDAWLKAACIQVGGEYQLGKHICLCPQGHFFRFRVNLESGVPEAACTTIEFRNPEERNEGSGLRLVNRRGKVGLTAVGYESFEDLKTEFRSLTLALPNLWRFVYTLWYGTLPSSLSDDGQSVVSFFNEDLTDELDFFLKAGHSVPEEYAGLPHSGAGLGGSLYVTRVMIEPERERLKDSIKGISDLNPALVKINAGLLEDRPRLSRAIRFLLDFIDTRTRSRFISESNSNTEYEAHSQFGCAEFCSFIEKWPKIENTGYSARWTKTYLSGAPFQNWIQILDRKERTSAQIFLTPIDDLSLLVVYDFTVGSMTIESLDQLDRAESVTEQLKIYERSGELIWKSSRIQKNPLVFQNSIYRPVLGLGFGEKYNEKSVRAVICEQGFGSIYDATDLGPKDIKADSEVNESILFGPHYDQSFYGWVRSPEPQRNFNSLVPSYWSGMVMQSFLTPGTLLGGSSSEHAREVSLAYLQSGGEKIVPIGLRDCVEKPELWVDSVRSQRVKVVNLSSVFAYDRDSCAKLKLVHTIRNSGLLWVGSSGNGAERIDRRRSYSCPGNQVLDQLILVAPGYSDGRINKSVATWGIEVADLVADGLHPYGSTYAASLAIPRVTAMAAIIAKHFENLTAYQIKLAILLGTTIHSDGRGELQFEEVSSGGSLNPDRAYEVAKMLSKYPHILNVREELVEKLMKVHCVFPSLGRNDRLCGSQVNQRLDRLVSNKIMRL